MAAMCERKNGCLYNQLEKLRQLEQNDDTSAAILELAVGRPQQSGFRNFVTVLLLARKS
jgi:hypothetical protein